MARFASMLCGLAFAAPLFVSGCGGGSAYPVSGEVTLDGQPLAAGFVTFSPADGRGPSDGGKVVNGKYKLTVSQPGEKFAIVNAADAPSGAPMSSAQANDPKFKDPKPAVVIKPNFIGNGAKLTVKGGDTHNIAIQSKRVQTSGG